MTSAATAEALPDAAPRPVRIMPLGDSITAGVGVPDRAGYREELFDELHRLGHDIDFVGPQKALGQRAGDADHAGYPGWRIEMIDAHISEWIPPASPDWVLLHIGTNNMYADSDAQAAPRLLETLVENILSARSQVKILLATIISSRSAGIQNRIRAYNSHVERIAGDPRWRDRVHCAKDMKEALKEADLDDVVHPNEQGYAKMSRVWRDALHPRLPAPRGGAILTRNPHFDTANLGPSSAARGSVTDFFPSWHNEGVSAYGSAVARTGNSSNAVGMFQASNFHGISTRLSTRPGVPVLTTFRAKSNTLGPSYGCGEPSELTRTFLVGANEKQTATVSTEVDWKTFSHEFVPDSNVTVLRFAPCGRPGCGPLITDVIAREIAGPGRGANTGEAV